MTVYRLRNGEIEEVINLHPDFVTWFVAAIEMALSCPMGRALYVCSKKRHTWPMIRHHKGYYMTPSPIQLMERMRHSTAERWLAHWLKGGSIHSLCYASDADALRAIRKSRDSRLDEGERLKREVRRARIKAKQLEAQCHE